MPIHIEELICNVTVTVGQSALVHPSPPPEAAPVAEQTAVAPKPLPSRTISRAEAKGILESTIARKIQKMQADGGGVPPGVDPKVLADRVYRLMREELELAGERE